VKAANGDFSLGNFTKALAAVLGVDPTSISPLITASGTDGTLSIDVIFTGSTRAEAQEKMNGLTGSQKASLQITALSAAPVFVATPAPPSDDLPRRGTGLVWIVGCGSLAAIALLGGGYFLYRGRRARTAAFQGASWDEELVPYTKPVAMAAAPFSL
jgi:hypothetical protein